MPAPPTQLGTRADIAAGSDLYHTFCFGCHGVAVRSATVMPDLRRMAPERHQLFDEIVLGGILEPLGMASFDDVLTSTQSMQIQAYIISRAHEDHGGTTPVPSIMPTSAATPPPSRPPSAKTCPSCG